MCKALRLHVVCEARVNRQSDSSVALASPRVGRGVKFTRHAYQSAELAGLCAVYSKDNYKHAHASVELASLCAE